MNWFKKIKAEIISPGEAIPDQYPGLYFEAIKLKDGTILWMQNASNHWVVYARYKQFIGDVKNVESTGFIEGDGAYRVKYFGEEAWRYLCPSLFKDKGEYELV